jgi:hypothetical protein
MSFVRGVAAVAAAAIVLAGCGGAIASPSATYTAVPIGPTAWPSGTTGQYGLRIDPSLLGKLPGHAGALPITEDAGTEAIELDDASVANTLDRYVAASAGAIGDADWLKIAIGHFKTDSQNGDVYSAWVSEYAAGACARADGISGSDRTEEIGYSTVDISTCAGGITVYTFQRGDWVVVSIQEFGPKHLGRALIAAIY